MATMRKRYNKWQVDYYLDGIRHRIQVSDASTAEKIISDITNIKGKKALKNSLKKILDTL